MPLLERHHISAARRENLENDIPLSRASLQAKKKPHSHGRVAGPSATPAIKDNGCQRSKKPAEFEPEEWRCYIILINAFCKQSTCVRTIFLII